MLGKLLKYDIRSTWRDFAGLYLIMVLGVIISSLMITYVDSGWVFVVTALFAVAITIATFVIMIVTLFKIYNTNVFSKEGYLTCTLPVSSTNMVLSKLVVSGMWITLTGIVATLCMFLLFKISAPDFWSEVRVLGLDRIFGLLESKAILLTVLTVIASIISTLMEISKLFLACTIAHLKMLRQFRIPAGIVSFFLFSWLSSELLDLAYSLFSRILPEQNVYFNVMELSAESVQYVAGEISQAMIFGIIFSLLFTAAYSAATIWLLERKLDLD